MQFASDNTAGAHPRVLEAIARANGGIEPSYGSDRWSAALNEALSAWFEREVFVFPVATGGAANALALSQVTPSWGAVVCHCESHINVDECGAPEFYTGGAKLVTVDGPAAKIGPEAVRQALAAHPAGVVHRMQAAAISLTQSTECGAVYQVDEVAALADTARHAGLATHMDGARLSNALATLGERPAAVTWQAGIDVLSLGFTKNGAIAAEAIVFFNAERADYFAYRRKRGGHLFSKMRFFAAQFLAMLEDELWLELAQAANASARRLGDIFAEQGLEPAFPVEANAVFVHLDQGHVHALREAGAVFHVWSGEGDQRPLCRFVCSYATQAADLEAFQNQLKLSAR